MIQKNARVVVLIKKAPKGAANGGGHHLYEIGATSLEVQKDDTDETFARRMRDSVARAGKRGNSVSSVAAERFADFTESRLLEMLRDGESGQERLIADIELMSRHGDRIFEWHEKEETIRLFPEIKIVTKEQDAETSAFLSELNNSGKGKGA